MHRNQTALQTTLRVTEIKLKVTEKIIKQIYWNLIGYHKTTNELFKNSVSMSVDDITNYYDFNKYILQSSATTATINNQNKNAAPTSAVT